MGNIFKINEEAISKIDFITDSMLLTLSGDSDKDIVISNLLKWFAKNNISVNMVMKQDFESEFSFSCSIQKKDLSKEKKDYICEKASAMELSLNIMDNLVEMTLSGVGMALEAGVAKRVFDSLIREEIMFYHITTSENSITVTIKEEDRMRAAIALGAEFEF